MLLSSSCRRESSFCWRVVSCKLLRIIVTRRHHLHRIGFIDRPAFGDDLQCVNTLSRLLFFRGRTPLPPRPSHTDFCRTSRRVPLLLLLSVCVSSMSKSAAKQVEMCCFHRAPRRLGIAHGRSEDAHFPSSGPRSEGCN